MSSSSEAGPSTKPNKFRNVQEGSFALLLLDKDPKVPEGKVWPSATLPIGTSALRTCPCLTMELSERLLFFGHIILNGDEQVEQDWLKREAGNLAKELREDLEYQIQNALEFYGTKHWNFENAKPHIRETLNLTYTAGQVPEHMSEFLKEFLKQWLGLSSVRVHTPDQEVVEPVAKDLVRVAGLVIKDPSEHTPPEFIFRDVTKHDDDKPSSINKAVKGNELWDGEAYEPIEAGGSCDFRNEFP